MDNNDLKNDVIEDFSNEFLEKDSFASFSDCFKKQGEITFSLILKEVSKHKFFGINSYISKELEILFVYKAVLYTKKYLKIYKNVNSLNLAKMCIKQFSYFYKNNTRIKDIYNARSKVKSGLLKSKLHDIALLFKVYNWVLHENNLRAENKCLLSLRYLKRNNIFKDFILVLSDTDFFTASESILFKKALLQSKKLRVILNKKNDICSSTDNSSFTDILDFSKENDIKINFKDYENNVSNGTFFYKAQSLHSELEFICQTMKRYLLKKEYKEDDFVIFVKDVSEYSDYLKQYLNEYDISSSFLFNENKPVNTPLLNTILLLFKLVSREDLKAQTLLAYLKNVMLSLK